MNARTTCLMSTRSCISAVAMLLYASSASAFTFDLIKGCTLIAQGAKLSASSPDAVHAAYCLGVLDGIFASRSKDQTGVQLPDPCFSKAQSQPAELAGQVVSVLEQKPRLLEVARATASDRGAMAAYLALAIANRCSSSPQPAK